MATETFSQKFTRLHNELLELSCRDDPEGEAAYQRVVAEIAKLPLEQGTAHVDRDEAETEPC